MFNACTAHPLHVVRMDFTEKKTYLANRSCTILGFLPVSIGDLEIKDGTLGVDETVLLHGFRS